MESITTTFQAKATQISSNEPSKVFNLCKKMYLGRINSNNIYRILLNFPAHMIPNKCIILKSTLRLYSQAALGKDISSYTPFVLSEDWSTNTVTWNNQPNFDINISGQTLPITGVGFYTFNITEIFTKWYTNKIPNFGLIIKNLELQNQTYAQIKTIINSILAPTIEITYIPKFQIQAPDLIKFIEYSEYICTNELFQFSTILDISMTKNITCNIQNLGNTEVEIHLQLSPDGINFYNDCPICKIISPHELVHMTPYVYAKYGRIAAKNVTGGETSKIKIWYQAQSY